MGKNIFFFWGCRLSLLTSWVLCDIMCETMTYSNFSTNPETIKKILLRNFSSDKEKIDFYKSGVAGTNPEAVKEFEVILGAFKEALEGRFIVVLNNWIRNIKHIEEIVPKNDISKMLITSIDSCCLEYDDFRFFCDYYDIVTNKVIRREPTFRYLLLLTCYVCGWPPEDYGLSDEIGTRTFLYDGSFYKEVGIIAKKHDVIYGVCIF